MTSKIGHSYLSQTMDEHLKRMYTLDEWLIRLLPCHLGCCPIRGKSISEDLFDEQCKHCISMLLEWVQEAKRKLEIHNKVAKAYAEKEGLHEAYGIAMKRLAKKYFPNAEYGGSIW